MKSGAGFAGTMTVSTLVASITAATDFQWAVTRSRVVFTFVFLLAKGEEPRPWPPLQGIVSMLVGGLAVLAIAGVILGIRWLLRLD